MSALDIKQHRYHGVTKKNAVILAGLQSDSPFLTYNSGFEIPGAAPAPRRCFFQYAGSPILIPALGAGEVYTCSDHVRLQHKQNARAY